MSSSAGKDAHALLRGLTLGFKQKFILVGLLTLLALAIVGQSGVAPANVPVAAYSFDETSGETAKDSAGDHDGTIEGASWVSFGKYGSALNFDGENDLVSIADAADLDLTGSFTLEAWVRPEAFGAARPVISKVGFPEAGVGGYQLEGTSAGMPLGRVAASGTVNGIEGADALPTGEVWSHLAFTSDGTTLRLYVNGDLAKSGEGFAATDTTATLKIGQGFGGWFAGLIDEVRLYDETLSESQIQVDRDTAIGLDPIPVAAYSFDEGSGAALGDSVGEHDGTIQGATWTSGGKYGSALDFDGIDDLVSIPDATALDLPNTFTLETWVRPDAPVDWSAVISKNESPESGYGPGYVLFADGSSEPRGWISNEGGSQAIEAATSLPSNEWSHLAFRQDESSLRLYINGKLSAQSSTKITAGSTDANLEFGHWDYFDTYFAGLIDEVRIYDEALSESQIQNDRDSRVEVPPATNVTTSLLDTGPQAELVSSLPITESGTPTTIYSLEAPSIEAGEIFRITANLELTNDQAYDVLDSVQVVLGSNPTDPNGDVVIPWTGVVHTPKMRHWTLPISGMYHATSSLGTRYLKVVAQASSDKANATDTETVQQNFGSLAAVRFTPATGSLSQPTHKIEPQIDPLPQLETSLPVDGSWHRVMTRKVDGLSVNDVVDLASQIEVQNPSSSTVTLESKITMTTFPWTGGSWASPRIDELLTADAPSRRMTNTNQFTVKDPAKRYFNLSVRATSESGTPPELTITPDVASLTVLRHEDRPRMPHAPIGDGTHSGNFGDATPNVSSIPFALAGGSEKRVVASAPIYGGIAKGDTIHSRGLITGDIGSTTEETQVLTRLILADSPVDTIGETMGVFSGDKIPPSMKIHTSVKEAAYPVPKAEAQTKYINFVVYASQPNPSGVMAVPAASVSYTRSVPTAPLSEGFEDGIDLEEMDSLDSVFEYEFNGELSASSAVSREGQRSLLVDVNKLEDNPIEERPGIRRVEVRPPDQAATGGHDQEDSWYGFSAYFPEDFQVPGPDPFVYFDGLIDEVRLYDQPLSEAAIADDMAGCYLQESECEEVISPVAAYGFDEGQGATVVDSAGENDGGVLGASWDASGKFGSALDFDGSAVDSDGPDEVLIPDANELDFSDAFTLEAWVRPDSLSLALGSPVLSKFDAPHGAISGYLLRAASVSAKADGLVAASGSTAKVNNASPLPIEEWSHIALSSDGNNLRLYVDGALVKAGAAIDAEPSEAALRIGSSNASLGTAGTYNMFTQFRHTDDGTLGCEHDPASVAIAFNARYREAGSSGVPTAGDYIEVALNGGEITADCAEAVLRPERYILTELSRGKWYDFVLHTRWTVEEGGPGNSVTEIWLNGEQVLGDQSIPISRPTLSWRLTPDQHNTAVVRQFGLYRGASVDDPAAKLYIDAVRSGNSYAEVAPGQ